MRASVAVVFVLACALLGILSPQVAAGGDELAPLEPVGQTPDLALGTVTALFEDRHGLLWIGTREGLVLYDGYTATVFEHDVADPSSLADNLVRTIYEDRDGRLWIGTNAGGLDRFDAFAGRFVHHRHDSSDPNTISHDSVNVILQDRAGSLWVGTQIGLNRMDPATGKVERIPHGGDAAGAIGHPYVYALHEQDNGDLWVGTVGGGLYRRPAGEQRFEHVSHDPALADFDSREKIFAIVEDGEGKLWVATESGVSVRMAGSDRLVPFTASPGSPALAPAIVTTLAEAGDETLWVGTWGDGIVRIDMASGEVLASPASPPGVDLPGARIVALLLDRSGALWCGTWEGGLYRARAAREGISAVAVTGDLYVTDTTAVLAARAGDLWIGTWGDGVRRISGEHGEAVRVAPGAGLDAGSVLSLVEDALGRLWVGRMDGLVRWTPAEGEVVRWQHDPARPSGIGPGYVTSVLVDSREAVWVGVGGGGLHRLRRDGRGFDRFVHRADDPTSLSENYVSVLREGPDGTIWVGTRSGGLNALDPDRGRFTRHLPDPTDPTTISHHYVSGIVAERRDEIWVATAGGGLNHGIRREDGGWTFERFGEPDGLIDDNIRSLVMDDDGSLWLGTGKGLSRFDPASLRFRNFGSTAIPTMSGFNIDAAARGPDALYFGTLDGVLRVARGSAFEPPAPSPVIVRAVRRFRGDTSHEQPAWALARVDVPWGDLLTIDFAVLDFDDVRGHRYQYRLGPRGEWIELGDRRAITFAELDPGTYRLEARGRDVYGMWSELQAPLTLVVVPPFWMTAWFRVLVLGLIVAAAYGWHVVRTSALERRNRELLQLKEERERALAEARRSQDELHRAYERLRGLTRRLELAKEEERKRIARELHDEMGQALTAAKINLQLLSPTADPEAAVARIDDTVGLVDRMIGHVRTLSLDLRPPLLDELGLGAALRGYLEAQSQRTGLEVRATIDALPSGLPPDVEITTFRTVQEAVTNVLRHADAKRIEVTLRCVDHELDVCVRDDGRGFDVERALERAANGSHLGLLGIRERVEGFGGRVEIRSNPGHGTVIEVRIPMPVTGGSGARHPGG